MAWSDSLSRLNRVTTSRFSDVALYGSVYIDGVFDNEYITVGENGVESTTPVYTCRAIDVPSVDHGDEFMVNDTCYLVRGVQPDGQGIVMLILEAV